MVLDDDIVEATEDHVIRLRVPEGETGVNLPRESEIIRVQDDGDSEYEKKFCGIPTKFYGQNFTTASSFSLAFYEYRHLP